MTYDERHIANSIAYAKKLEAAFIEAGKQAAAMAEKHNAKFAKSFAFDKNYVLAKEAKAIFNDLHSNVVQIIKTGNATEWALSNNKNDELVNSYVKNLSVLKKKPDWTSHNESALQAFTNREVEGLNLSDRIWKQVDQYRAELEVHVGYGILNGDSAAIISQRVRQYLNDPKMLFRRIRNEMGELEWSKAAKAYHPGQGKYRSSYLNARRLTLTETNMAYRQADHTRWNQLGFVKGFEVKLSGQHPVFDICDSVKGKYPKTFIFVGWHPQCFCHAVAITMDMEEFSRYQQSILDGTEEEFLKTVKPIDQVPEGFTNWIKTNTERSKGWASQPYFIRDNFKNGTIEGGLKLITPVKAPAAPAPVVTPAPVDRISIYAQNLIEASKKLGVDTGSEMTFEEANELKGNINFEKSINYRINCQSCVVSNELRRRGLNVTAMPNMNKAGNIPYQLSRRTEMAWIDPTTGQYPVKKIAGRGARRVTSMSNELSQIMAETGRYNIDFVWKGARSGHIISAEKLDSGNFRFYDPQNGKIVSWGNLSSRISLKYGVSILRVDNLLVNNDLVNGVVSKL